MCESNATHFAILAEQEEPSEFRHFFAAPCGTTLVASDRTPTGPPSTAPFECKELVAGMAFEVSLSQQDGGFQRLQGRVEANTRVRAEVRSETGQADDWETRVERESRLEICAFLQFVDKDGDGVFGPFDAVVSTTLAAFANLTHTIEGTMHVFVAAATGGKLTVTIRIPATFPAAGDPLIQWAVAATPTRDARSTHYGVELRHGTSMQSEEFLVAACGTPLSGMGES